MFKRKRSKAGYWFTIQSPNGQTLATSETYTTAAMRDKGIEAVKKVVCGVVNSDGKQKVINYLVGKPSDTFHIENKKGKIVKR